MSPCAHQTTALNPFQWLPNGDKFVEFSIKLSHVNLFAGELCYVKRLALIFMSIPFS